MGYRRRDKNSSEFIITEFESAVEHAIQGLSSNKLLLGISGGADSVALLTSLVSLKADVIAVHCNFHLRGEESNRDQLFVEELCKKLNVELNVVHFDVDKYRAETGTSIEMACRELRYAKFRELKHELSIERIAVAHNADDNIETLMLNLFRGSGVKGLKGMLPDTGEIIRPLLMQSRDNIIRYLLAKQVSYVTDSSNLEDDYRRNYIRNRLLPDIEERWPGVRKAITTTLSNLRTEERVLENISNDILQNTTPTLSYDTIINSPDAYWIIFQFASKYGTSRLIASEIFDVFTKRYGTQHIIGKRWKIRDGALIFDKKGLTFLPN